MKAILFDTETSDLIRNKHRPISQLPHITELFALTLEMKGKSKAWKETGAWHSLFNPGIPLTKEITRITGLDDDQLKDQPRFGAKAKELKALIEGADIIVAHNLSFDKEMVNIEMRRVEIEVKWPERLICTVEASEHFKSRRLKLIELHEFLFGIPFEGAHRAENDVRPMARCFIELWERGVL